MDSPQISGNCPTGFLYTDDGAQDAANEDSDEEMADVGDSDEEMADAGDSDEEGFGSWIGCAAPLSVSQRLGCLDKEMEILQQFSDLMIQHCWNPRPNRPIQYRLGVDGITLV